MSEIDALKEKVEECRRAVKAAQMRLDTAEEELLLARFEGWERFKRGDRVVVPRKLFGKTQPWPAVVTHVRLNFSEGDYKDDGRYDWSGKHWENQSVSYGVDFLDKKTDQPTGQGDHYYHKDVSRAPAA
jgi:hypothetical protein